MARPLDPRLLGRLRRVLNPRSRPAQGDPLPPQQHARTEPLADMDPAQSGLPSMEYAATPDGRPDPGEVVWTWVPYEEDASQGKDRPVLLIGRESAEVLVALPLTTKNHRLDAAQEAREGRFWIDVGPGGWDSRGRPSQAALHRVVRVRVGDIRREGSILDRARFDQVTAALREFWSRQPRPGRT